MQKSSSTKKQIMLCGVLGLAVNDKSEFLLTQRHQPEDPEVHGLWQIPGGGMEFGETPEQTLSREMQEELGVSVRMLHQLPIAKTAVWDLKDRKVHITLLIYVVSVDKQTPTIGDPETAAIGWYSVKKIYDLPLMGLTTEIIEDAQRFILVNSQK